MKKQIAIFLAGALFWASSHAREDAISSNFSPELRKFLAERPAARELLNTTMAEVFPPGRDCRVFYFYPGDPWGPDAYHFYGGSPPLAHVNICIQMNRHPLDQFINILFETLNSKGENEFNKIYSSGSIAQSKSEYTEAILKVEFRAGKATRDLLKTLKWKPEDKVQSQLLSEFLDFTNDLHRMKSTYPGLGKSYEREYDKQASSSLDQIIRNIPFHTAGDGKAHIEQRNALSPSLGIFLKKYPLAYTRIKNLLLQTFPNSTLKILYFYSQSKSRTGVSLFVSGKSELLLIPHDQHPLDVLIGIFSQIQQYIADVTYLKLIDEVQRENISKDAFVQNTLRLHYDTKKNIQDFPLGLKMSEEDIAGARFPKDHDDVPAYFETYLASLMKLPPEQNPAVEYRLIYEGLQREALEWRRKELRKAEPASPYTVKEEKLKLHPDIRQDPEPAFELNSDALQEQELNLQSIVSH